MGDYPGGRKVLKRVVRRERQEEGLSRAGVRVGAEVRGAGFEWDGHHKLKGQEQRLPYSLQKEHSSADTLILIS